MGTPGHMGHPFDVDRIKTGQDLIDYINDAVLRLQNQEIAGSLCEKEDPGMTPKVTPKWHPFGEAT